METLIYGVLDGNEDWQEELLYDGGELLSDGQIDAIKREAAADGFSLFRVTTFDPGTLPDCRNVIN